MANLATLEGGSCTKNMISTVGYSYSFAYRTPDRCGWHPKHIEWTCRIINRLLCVSSRWTIINIKRHEFTEPSTLQVSSLCTYTQWSSICKLSDLFTVRSKLFFVNCSVSRVRFLHVSSRLTTRLALLSALLFTNLLCSWLYFLLWSLFSSRLYLFESYNLWTPSFIPWYK